MATDGPQAANDDTAGPVERPPLAQQAAPYVDCLTPLLEQSEARLGDAALATDWPEKFIGGCWFGFQHPEMAWPDRGARGLACAVIRAIMRPVGVAAAIVAGVFALSILLRLLSY